MKDFITDPIGILTLVVLALATTMFIQIKTNCNEPEDFKKVDQICKESFLKECYSHTNRLQEECETLSITACLECKVDLE